MNRKEFLQKSIALAGFSAFAPLTALRAQSGIKDLVEFRRLVAANRILANEGVLDAFGHVSVRDPRNPNRYVMSYSRSPELVELSDLLEFESDGTPVDSSDGRRPYGERMIHGAIYESRADVNAVVHHHSYTVVPFSVSDVPLRPVAHVGSVIGAEVPVWDIRDNFGATDMLVRSMEMGRDLAAVLGNAVCLLMRGHGAVVTAPTVQEVVLASVYMRVNAEILTQALQFGEPRYLSPEEIELSAAAQNSQIAIDRTWEYFCMRAGIDPN